MWEAYKIKSKIEINEFYSAFVRYCKNEYVFGGEAHDFWEIVYILEGVAEISADDRILKLRKNQIIFHKPMEFHAIRPADNTNPKLFILSFSASGKIMNRFKNKIFHLDPKLHSMLMQILKFMEENNNIESQNTTPVTYLQRFSDGSCYGQTVKNMTENFLMTLYNAGSLDSQLLENNETVIYNKAISFIDKTIYERISVPAVSKECNVSLAYLKKIFAKYTGLGIHEYILKSKISLAKQMLDSGSSVKSISNKLAFSSQNYFSYVFKRETGISPSEYKKDSHLK